MPKPIATWSSELDCWIRYDDETESLFSVQPVVWSETWPSSGTARDGSLFPPPASVPPTVASASSSSALLPTPRVSSERTSRGALTADGHWSAPGLAQAIELAQGILPREYDSWDEVQGRSGRMLPTPAAADGSGAGRGNTDRHQTVPGVVADLLPTPSAADSLGGHVTRSGDRADELLLGGIAKAHASDALLPTPRATDGPKGGPSQRGSSGDLMLPSAVAGLEEEPVGPLLPTPNPFHAGNTENPEEWRERRADVFARTGTRHGPALSVVAWSIEEGNPLTPDRYMPDEDDDPVEPPTGELLPTPMARDTRTYQRPVPNGLLPTPTAGDAASSGNRPSQGDVSLTDATVRGRTRWGDYQPAIDRWTRILGRPPANPTQTGSKGNPQLAPPFVEWMMGLIAGWVTDPAIWAGWKATTARNAMLKALGNGVVPQQAYAALSELVSWGPLWDEDEAA